MSAILFQTGRLSFGMIEVNFVAEATTFLIWCLLESEKSRRWEDYKFWVNHSVLNWFKACR